jgi:phosphoribosylglycinamide formyltransferase-1
MPIRLAVLLSGSGTTLQNIIDRIGRGELDAEVAGVVSSRVNVYGLERAKNHNIPAATVARKSFASHGERNPYLHARPRGAGGVHVPDRCAC